MIEKYKLRRIRVAIRHVLMEKWDPIGVADEPMAADEYDGYIGGIFELLELSASRTEIEEHLRKIEMKNMGLTDATGVPFMSEQLRFGAVDELRRVFREQMLID